MGCIILKVRKVLKQECTDAPYKKGWGDHGFPASTDPGAAISSKMVSSSSIKDMIRMEPLHLGHSSGSVW